MLVSKFVSRVKSALESFPLNSRVVYNTPYSGGEFPPRLKLKSKGLVILFIVMPFQETSGRNKEMKKKKQKTMRAVVHGHPVISLSLLLI